jgi:hypothetical protein
VIIFATSVGEDWTREHGEVTRETLPMNEMKARECTRNGKNFQESHRGDKHERKIPECQKQKNYVQWNVILSLMNDQ